MNDMKASILFIAACICSVAAPAFAQFDTRFGIPAGTDLKKLASSPEILRYDMRRYHDEKNQEDRISGYADSHAVLDAPFWAVVYYLNTPEEAKALSSRLLDNRVESRSGNSWVCYQEVGIEFLGSRVGYKVRFLYESVSFSDGSAGGRSRMLESLDGNLFEAFTSWYAVPIVVEGKTYTYVRMFSRNGLRKPAWGLETIAGIFAPGEIKENYRILAELARKKK
jgi:hypothetical protein